MIGERQGRHGEVFCFFDKHGWAGCPIVEAVIGMNVKVDERHGRSPLTN
jgi:hypothetical protein